ncbi:MAG: ATP-binding protein [Lachnospiraceae bacterium]|nr:ATP-binding protein [Lachnospiraceae bacterium]
MIFYGRESERNKINRNLRKNTMQISLIYGRRRVGKSELIKQCLREHSGKSIYYECKQTTEANNVGSLSVLVGELFHFPTPAFQGIEMLLDYLFNTATDESLILVLDEYPYLRENVKGIDSILQSLIDKHRDTSRLKLILCGSYVDTMKSLLMRENPLFGRVDLTIDLKPMDYFESSLFYPDFSDEEKIQLYSVFGGIPYYNKLIDSELSVRENIIELIASPGARLENEVSMYLKSEISRITNANEVFDALSKGFSRFNDILSQSHVSSSPTLVDVLDKLIRMEMVIKESPINNPTNKRKTGYYIIDNLSLFYYRYIYRYLSQMNVMDSDVFFDRYIKKDFEEQYVPKIFETICKQYLIRKNKAGELDPPFDLIGKYYYDDPKTRTNGEFDIVTKDPLGYIFYEAKFRKDPVSKEMIQTEIEQVEKTGLNCYKYGFISKSGFSTDADEHMIFIQLSDLFHCS